MRVAWCNLKIKISCKPNSEIIELCVNSVGGVFKRGESVVFEWCGGVVFEEEVLVIFKRQRCGEVGEDVYVRGGKMLFTKGT